MPQHTDPLLDLVAKISAQMGDDTQGRAEMPVVLHVGGLLITGRIISSRQFFLAHSLTDQILEVQARLAQAPPALADQLEDEGLVFIHLAGARFFVPGLPPIPDHDDFYWRVNAAHVSGFSFGRLTMSDARHA